MHHAVDDYSRLAYSEILADERQEAAAGFWQRAQTCFADTGITVTAVMTDNGSCYRSRLFKATLGQHLKHRFTRPYRPQTNSKVERFNRTLTQEWADADTYYSDEARAATYKTCYTTIIITDPTSASAASPQPNEFTTSRGITLRRCPV